MPGRGPLPAGIGGPTCYLHNDFLAARPVLKITGLHALPGTPFPPVCTCPSASSNLIRPPLTPSSASLLFCCATSAKLLNPSEPHL